MAMKTCIRCDEEKPEEEGTSGETELTGPYFICDPCQQEAEEEAKERQENKPETPLDLSDTETAEDAAKEFHSFLSEYVAWMKEEEEASEEVTLMDPEEAGEKMDGHDCWTVVWSSGPYKWGVWLTGGESLFRGEHHGEITSSEPNPEVVGLTNNGNWVAEPYYGKDIQFSNL